MLKQAKTQKSSQFDCQFEVQFEVKFGSTKRFPVNLCFFKPSIVFQVEIFIKLYTYIILIMKNFLCPTNALLTWNQGSATGRATRPGNFRPGFSITSTRVFDPEIFDPGWQVISVVEAVHTSLKPQPFLEKITFQAFQRHLTISRRVFQENPTIFRHERPPLDEILLFIRLHTLGKF